MRENIFAPIIERNTVIPASRERMFSPIEVNEGINAVLRDQSIQPMRDETLVVVASDFYTKNRNLIASSVIVENKLYETTQELAALQFSREKESSSYNTLKSNLRAVFRERDSLQHAIANEIPSLTESRDYWKKEAEHWKESTTKLLGEEDEVRTILSKLSLFLSQGGGDELTPIGDLCKRVEDGVKMACDAAVGWRNRAISERDAALEESKELRQELENQEAEHNTAMMCIYSRVHDAEDDAAKFETFANKALEENKQLELSRYEIERKLRDQLAIQEESDELIRRQSSNSSQAGADLEKAKHKEQER
jgi:hypothetical protein